MGRLLAPRVANCPGDNESAHGPHETVWQHIDRMADFVFHRQDILVVVDQTNVTVAGVEEYLLRAEVVRRSIEANDEMTREEILLQHFVIGVRVDEDIRKR